MKWIRKNLPSFTREEDGVVAVFIALAMVVLLSFTSLGIDAAVVYYSRSHIQAAVDAAALAAVHDLPDKTKATETAKEYLRKNNCSTDNVLVQFPESGVVRVVVNETTKTIFSNIFNAASINTNAVAAAKFINKEMSITCPYNLLGASDTAVSELQGQWNISGDVHFNNNVTIGGSNSCVIQGNATSAKKCNAEGQITVKGSVLSNVARVTMPDYDDLIMSVAPTFPEGIFDVYRTTRPTTVVSSNQSSSVFYKDNASIYQFLNWNTLIMNGPLTITDGWNSPWANSSDYNGNMFVEGNATFNGSVTNIYGDLYCTGDINFAGGTIVVTGNVYCEGKITCGAWTKVDISGNIYSGGNCEFTGSANPKNFQSIYAKGAVKINGTAYVYGDIYAGGNLEFSGNNPAVTTNGGAIYAGGNFTTGQGFCTKGIIIIEKDINIGGSPCTMDGSDGALALYSRTGNIYLSPGNGMVAKGMIYAPHGTISFYSGGMTFEGNILGDVIKMSPGGLNMLEAEGITWPWSSGAKVAALIE